MKDFSEFQDLFITEKEKTEPLCYLSVYLYKPFISGTDKDIKSKSLLYIVLNIYTLHIVLYEIKFQTLDKLKFTY